MLRRARAGKALSKSVAVILPLPSRSNTLNAVRSTGSVKSPWMSKDAAKNSVYSMAPEPLLLRLAMTDRTCLGFTSMPAVLKPACNSPRLTVPSLSASNFWNSARNSSKRGCPRDLAATSKAAFRNSLSALNRLKRSTIAKSNPTFDASGATFSIQSWRSAASAARRRPGCTCNMSLMRTFASSLTWAQRSRWKSRRPRLMSLSVSSCERPLNGARPTSRMCKMTPTLQTSHCLLYLPSMTCGDT
mmetsp:Transcript_54565/g.165876  ORF Transcript_54565/g.165876 Transcript_54565/m.165876 type:complete len:245 (-) Transcript_54565:537-1271(-)